MRCSCFGIFEVVKGAPAKVATEWGSIPNAIAETNHGAADVFDAPPTDGTDTGICSGAVPCGVDCAVAGKMPEKEVAGMSA